MKSLIVILALVSSSAFAMNTKKSMKMFNNVEKLDHKCSGLNISKEQKTDIIKAVMEMRKTVKPLRADLKMARKAKRKVMMNTKTTKAEAVAAMKDVKTARKPIRKIRKSTMLDIQFDILTGEQRVKLLKCMKKHRRGRRAPRG